MLTDPATSVSELLRSAIVDVLGLRVKFIARVQPTLSQPASQSTAQPATQQTRPPQPPADDIPEPIEPDLEPDVDAGGWAVAAIPTSSDPEPESTVAIGPSETTANLVCLSLRRA